MPEFQIVSDYKPSGDQPEAIEKLAERIDQHLDHVSDLFDKTWSRWHDDDNE